MNAKHPSRLSVVAACAASIVLGAASPAHAADAPLRVVAGNTSLADLAREVGGDRVSVVSMLDACAQAPVAKAPPGLLEELSRADLLLVAGPGPEDGFLPQLLGAAHNPRVMPEAAGYLDAAKAIVAARRANGNADTAKQETTGEGAAAVDSLELLDPVDGLAAAQAIRDRLSKMSPDAEAYFQGRFADFRARLAGILVGPELAAKEDAFRLAQLAESGELPAWLAQHGDSGTLHGLLGAMLPFRGRKVVDDRPAWTRFARRFGLEVVAHLEPAPGLPPTDKHLQAVIAAMKAANARVVIVSSCSDRGAASVVREATGARVLGLAPQVGSLDGTSTWLDMIAVNVRAAALVLMATR